MSRRVGVVLSGCGVYDGAEIYESVITLLALDRADATVICMAPRVDQMHVINHATGEVVEGEVRNVFVEAARLARGQIRDIAEVKHGDLDALIFPGGFGAAKNLCDFAVKGGDCSVHPEVERLIREVHDAKKPLGFICIAPALAARVLGKSVGVSVTIGNDADTAKAIESCGAKHVECPVQEIAVDVANKVVTTPAYMLAGRISEAAAGIEALVERVLSLS